LAAAIDFVASARSALRRAASSATRLRRDAIPGERSESIASATSAIAKMPSAGGDAVTDVA
jgi:hypothetical protein